MSKPFLLVYSTGSDGTPYYYHTWIDKKGVSHWTVTNDRSKATTFKSRADALNKYRKIHAFSKHYEHLITEGKVRAESVDQFSIPFN